MSTLKKKLSSRKLWAAIAGFVAGIATAFCTYLPEYARVAGIIGAIASNIAYILSEGNIDAASVSAQATQPITTPEDTDDPCENLNVTETEYGM